MIITEELRNILEDKLFIEEFLKPEDEKKFLAVMEKYLLNRSAVSTFVKNLDDTIAFYEVVGVTYDKMLQSIMKWPAIIHADKNELFKKYLLAALIINSQTGECDRKNILIEHPKDFMTGLDTIYSRIMYLKSGSADLRDEHVTRRKIFKATHTEFYEMYGVSKNQLLRIYIIDDDIIEEIKKWDVNKELVRKYEGKGFGKRAS